jgi:putative hydrolase of the HAD superfamily
VDKPAPKRKVCKKEVAMSLRSFKVLTFDVVGTLIDFEQGMIDYLHKVAPSSSLKEEDFLIAYRNARARKQSGWYPDDLVRVWKEIAIEYDLPNTEEIARGFKNSIKYWPAFPDSVKALTLLKNRYELVAMTNTQGWALSYFAETLDNPFDDLVGSDDALCEKPNPMFFAFARGRLSTKGYFIKDILHVAQSQYHDIGVAHSLGYAVCWIERRHGKGFGATKTVEHITTPDYHYQSLSELADAVEQDNK